VICLLLEWEERVRALYGGVCVNLGVSVSAASLADVYLSFLPMCGSAKRYFMLQYYVTDTCSVRVLYGGAWIFRSFS
jgi:hypothetical protein